MLVSAHFIETTTGIATIRAHCWNTDYKICNQELLNTSQRPVYLLTMLQQWLALTLNMTVAALAILFVSLVTQLRAWSGFAGVGLVSLMSFGEMLSSTIKSWTHLETSLGAISRLNSFRESVKSENMSGETEEPDECWPH